jgi:nitrate/nitrite transporter NarK
MDIGKKYAGSVSGSMNMAGQVGSFASTALFGYLVKWLGNDYNKALVPLAVMLLISAALYVFIDPTEQLVVEKAETPAPHPVPA